MNDPLRVLITGGSSGIGLATAARFAASAATVVSLDLVRPPEGTRCGWVQVDVRDDASVRAGVETAVQELGGLDVLVNNTGIGAAGTVEDNDDAQWHRVLDVNLMGVVRVTRASLPHLRRSPRAAIVNTCSIAATVGLPERALYGASKGAVLALTLAMAADHLREGIRVNAVNPGTTRTPWIGRLLEAAADPQAELAALAARQPLGRLVSADEVAEAIHYLGSPAAGATTGTWITVDGGLQTLRLRTR